MYDSSVFFLYKLNLFLKIKNIDFFIIFLIYAILHSIFSFYKFYVYVDFYYKLILIINFIKYNWLNDMCCGIKYPDLYFSLNFSSFVFIHCQFFYQTTSISCLMTHDKYVIWTYFMFRLWVLCVNPVLLETKKIL
jgi:hypothetical protein